MAAPQKVILYGAGGHGKVLADAIGLDPTCTLLGFIDDSRSGDVLGYPILGGMEALEKLMKQGVHCIVAIGDCAGRAKIQAMLEEKGFGMATVIHPSATISRSARIGAGSAILAHANVGPDAELGKGCIVNTGASVDHDCMIADFTHIAPGAHVAGGVRIGRQTFVGIGSSVRELCTIGSNVTIGAGAAVVSNIPNAVTALGVPAVVRN